MMRGMLDLDDVLADCNGGIARQFSNIISYEDYCSLSHKDRKAVIGEENVSKLFNEESFWVNLEKLPWADTLVGMFDSIFDEWFFLTKGVPLPSCYSGKHKWIKNNYPKHLDKIWICPKDKHNMCSGPKDFLVDDYSKNILNWLNRGGGAHHWLADLSWSSEQYDKHMLEIPESVAEQEKKFLTV